MILLDTHVLVWLALEPRRLSVAARDAIRKAMRAGGLGIAAISLWEMAYLMHAGRVLAQGAPGAWLEELLRRTGVVVREITPTIAVLASQFPEDFPRDPADRLIAATARAEGFALVTRDAQIRRSRLLKTVW